MVGARHVMLNHEARTALGTSASLRSSSLLGAAAETPPVPVLTQTHPGHVPAMLCSGNLGTASPVLYPVVIWRESVINAP